MAKYCVNLPLSLLIFLLAATISDAQETDTPSGQPELSASAPDSPSAESPGTEPAPRKKSAARQLIMYIPNRLFDIADIVRAKVGVGPGVTVAARVTDLGDVWVGGHTCAWVRFGQAAPF